MRIETGVRAGDAISPYYDPMIAKLVVHGADRGSALAAMESALNDTEIAGTTTNARFLAALIRDEGFATGDVDTGLIDRNLAELTVPAAADAGAKELAILFASGLLSKPLTVDPLTALRGSIIIAGSPIQWFLKRLQYSSLWRHRAWRRTLRGHWS